MKLLLVFAFLAAASAAQIKVQPLVLPGAPKPEVYEVPETLLKQEIHDAVKIKDAVDDDTNYSVKFVDAAELPDEETSIPFQMIDISPLIVPDEIMKMLIENSANFDDGPVDAVRIIDAPLDAIQVVDAPVDAVQVVEAPVDAVKFVNAPVDAVQVVEAPVDAVKFVNAPVDAIQFVNIPVEQKFDIFYVPFVGFEVNVDPVQIVDGPVDAEGAIVPEAPFGDVQVDPVVIVSSAQNEMPLEYRRDLPVYADAMLR